MSYEGSRAPQANGIAKNAFQCIYNGASQKVTYTGTAGTITNAVAAGVSVVRIVVTSDAFIKIGTSPTATANDIFIPANVPEYFGIKTGEKVSAIQSSAGGTLYVTEGAI